jgi:hypothetical protein
VDHDLIGGGWQRLVYPPERPEQTVDRRTDTLCLLEQFHRHLKHRNIFAEHSSKWRDPRAHLLSGMAWESARDRGMNALGLPGNPRAMLGELAQSLDGAYRELAAHLGQDTSASVDEDGKLHVAALSAMPDPPSLVDLRRRTAAMMPRVDLPEMVLEMMSWLPGFAESFTQVAGTSARVADLGVSVAAVLCSQAMNVGLTPVTTPGADALTRDRLRHVDQHYLRADTLSAANTVLVNAQADVPLAQLWGGGCVASVDGMRFVVPVRTIHARPNRKYFGPKRGATWAEHALGPGGRAQRDGGVGHAPRLAQRHRRDPAATRRQQSFRRHHFRQWVVFGHRVRAPASTRSQVSPAAEEFARSAAVAHRPNRRLRACPGLPGP